MTRRDTLAVVALLAVLGVASAARFCGIGFGLPLPYARPDENRVARDATQILRGNWRPASFAYPALLATTNAGVRWILHQFGSGASPQLRADEVYPEAYWISRLISATAGVATVLVVFLIGRRLRSTFEGLLAALLLAVTHLHCRDSHFGVTDVLMTFCTTAVLWLLLRTEKWRSLRRFALAGAAIGVAVAAKQPALFAFAPLLVAAFAPPADEGAQQRRGGSRLARGTVAALIAGACALALFLLINPHALLEPRRFLDDVLFEFQNKTAARELLSERGWVTHARFTLWHGLGAPCAIAALVGLAVTCARGRRGDWIVLGFALAYYVGMGSGSRTFARYMVPLTPIAALLAARAIAATAALAPKRVEAATALLLAALVASVSASRVVATDRLLVAQDTRLAAVEFLRREVRPDERVLWLGRYASPPTDRPDERFVREDGAYLQSLLADGRDPDAALADAGFRYVVWADYFFATQFDAPSELTTRLAESLVEVKTFRPLADGVAKSDVAPLFDRRDMLYLPYAGFDGFERPGPFVHVFRRRD